MNYLEQNGGASFRDTIPYPNEIPMEREGFYTDPTAVPEIEDAIEKGYKDELAIRYAQFIREKMYGADVRESIARFGLWLDVRINEIEKQNLEVIEEYKEIKNLIEDLETKFDLAMSGLTVDSELILSRYSKMLKKNFVVFGDRADFWDESIEHLNGYNIEWLREAGMSDVELFKKAVIEKKRIFVPPRIYNIDAKKGSIEILSDTTITFSKDTVINIMPNDLESYRIFSIDNESKNVNLIGNWATINGDKDSHLGTTGEWGRLIALGKCENVFIDEFNLDNSWGDGLYIGGKGYENRSRNIKIGEISCDGNRRQGISVINVEGLTVNRLFLNNTNGTNPQYGIDFEPNNPGEVLLKITINEIITSNNTGGAVLFALRLMADSETKKNISVSIGRIVSENDTVTLENQTSRLLTGSIRGFIKISEVISRNAKKQAVLAVNHSELNELFSLGNVMVYNHNNLNLSGKEAYALLAENNLSDVKIDNFHIKYLYIYTENDSGYGVYYNAPSGVNLQLGMYSPHLTEKSMQNPSNIFYLQRGNSSKKLTLNYEKRPTIALENVVDARSIVEMLCYTNSGRSIELPRASQNNDLEILFTSGNADGNIKYPTIRTGSLDKIITNKGVVEGSKILVLNTHGAFYKFTSFMGYWRLSEASGDFEIR
ncbi:hypothetical protein [Vagococcus fluvialis]|uniref:hypothetical protein n=1 Tax=Vagococcus fluvialis TaxID=2738 RepID=UPI003D0ABDF3